MGERLRVVAGEIEEVRRRREVVEEALMEYADAEREVGRGGSGKGDGMVMRRLGWRYGEIEREIEEVKRDVERLRRRRDGEAAEDEDESWIH